MTYKEFVKKVVSEKISEYGSLREMGRQMNVDPGMLSKIKNGKVTPSVKWMERNFPNMEFEKFETMIIVHQPEYKLEIQCESLEELKTKLDVIGYELIIKKKES